MMLVGCLRIGVRHVCIRSLRMIIASGRLSLLHMACLQTRARTHTHGARWWHAIAWWIYLSIRIGLQDLCRLGRCVHCLCMLSCACACHGMSGHWPRRSTDARRA